MQFRPRLVVYSIALITILHFLIWNRLMDQIPSSNDPEFYEIEHDIGGRKIIVFWTKFFGVDDPNLSLAGCPQFEKKCIVTTNRLMVNHASAVVFHYQSGDFSVRDVPRNRSPLQRYVVMTMESPYHFAFLNRFWIRHSPANFFNWSMNFRSDSDIAHNYGGYGWLSPEKNKEYNFTPYHEPYDEQSIIAKKNGAAFWLVSKCITPSKREDAVAKLAKYLMIDVYGECAKDSQKRNDCAYLTECEEELASRYYFYIAIENSVCKDYITEKYWNRYQFPAIPIVMKRYVYEPYLPTRSFIAMDDFKSAKEMANYLFELINNKTKYFEYFKWRTSGWVRILQNEQHRFGYCKLCEALNQNLPNKVIPDAERWLTDRSQCEGSEFADSWDDQ